MQVHVFWQRAASNGRLSASDNFRPPLDDAQETESRPGGFGAALLPESLNRLRRRVEQACQNILTDTENLDSQGGNLRGDMGLGGAGASTSRVVSVFAALGVGDGVFEAGLDSREGDAGLCGIVLHGFTRFSRRARARRASAARRFVPASFWLKLDLSFFQMPRAYKFVLSPENRQRQSEPNRSSPFRRLRSGFS